MSKRILIFKGVSRYEVLRRAADAVAQGFINMGCEVVMLDSTSPDFSLDPILNGRFDMCLVMQAFIFDTKMKDGLPFIAHINMPWIGWIFDDVLYHFGRILANRFPNVSILSVDAAADGAMKRMGIACNPIGALLHGGFEVESIDALSGINASYLKDIDILCPCTLGKPPVWSRTPSESDLKLADDAIAAFRRNPELSPRQALDEACRQNGTAFEGRAAIELSEVLLYVTGSMRYLCRKAIIDAAAASGLNLHLIGEQHDDSLYPDNVTIHGPMNIDDAVRLTARSKILINPFPTVYEGGAHERIFTAMLNRAVCFTPGSPFLRALLGDRVEFIDLKELLDSSDNAKHPKNRTEPSLCVRMREILVHTDESRLDAVRDYARRNHTWAVRAEELLNHL